MAALTTSTVSNDGEAPTGARRSERGMRCPAAKRSASLLSPSPHALRSPLGRRLGRSPRTGVRKAQCGQPQKLFHLAVEAHAGAAE